MKNMPAYKRIQHDIMKAIADGTYLPGAKIATEAELMQHYAVSRITAQRALSELQQHGIVERRPRVGTLVAQGSPRPVVPQESESKAGHGAMFRIAVIAPFDMSSSCTYQYLSGIMPAIDTSQMHLALYNTSRQLDIERAILERCMNGEADGIIYYPSSGAAQLRDLLIRISSFHIPCVLIDKVISGINLPCVKTDNMQAMCELTQKALKRGAQRLCFIANNANSSSGWERYAGFCQALAKAPQPVSEARYFCETLEEPEKLLQLVKQERLDCLCCATDYCAQKIMDICTRVGLKVPHQLFVTGFDDVYGGAIATMRQQYESIGARAAEILIKWMLNGEVCRDVICMPAKFVDGNSLRKEGNT